MGSEEPQEEATLFLAKLKQADKPAVLTQFGDNTCHCQPRGGYIAFLKYESGENDNLAFLFGHDFASRITATRAVPTKEKFQGSNLPWEQPESTEVDVALDFARKSYQPYFLPLDMAYGYLTKEEALKEFCADPSKDFWKGLALRLRPGLAPGLVKAPEKRNKPEFMADYYLTLGLPEEECKYLKPKDAAGVIESKSGKEVPAENFKNELPRLKSAMLRMSVVRRGRFARWSVKKASLLDPCFELSNQKELKLKSPELPGATENDSPEAGKN